LPSRFTASALYLAGAGPTDESHLSTVDGIEDYTYVTDQWHMKQINVITSAASLTSRGTAPSTARKVGPAMDAGSELMWLVGDGCVLLASSRPRRCNGWGANPATGERMLGDDGRSPRRTPDVRARHLLCRGGALRAIHPRNAAAPAPRRST
jgi:hypothetical protein